MNIIRVADRDDRRLADYAGVREPARLRERGLLIAEGRFVVRRLLLESSRRITLRSLLLNDAALGALGDLLERAGPSVDIYVASPEVIKAATGFNMHRGCLALAERPAELLIDDVISTARYVTVLERVVDADNVGSVFRSAEAFGVDAVLLSPGLLRSVLPQGDPDVFRRRLDAAVGHGRPMARRTRSAAGQRLHDRRDDTW